MQVFCSSCGTANEGEPGQKIICPTCTAIFEVPQGLKPAAAVIIPEVVSSAPTWETPERGPLVGVQAPSAHPLAIVSLVAGLVFCVPFSGLVAVITGAVAVSKINAAPQTRGGKGLAIAGICLGGFWMLISAVVVGLTLLASR